MGIKKIPGLLIIGLLLAGLGDLAPLSQNSWPTSSAMAQLSPEQSQALTADRLFAEQQYEAALALYQAVLPETTSPDDQIHLQKQIGRSLLLLERYADAIPVLESLITLRTQIWGYGMEPDQSNLGLAYYHTGQLTQAEAVLKAAIAGWESIRSDDALSDLDKVTLFEQQAYTYSLLQRVLMAQGKTEEALVLSEASRARSLVEQLAQQAAHRQSSVSSLTLAEIKQVAHQEQATIVTYSILGNGRRVLGNEVETETDLLIWVTQPSGEIMAKAVPLQPVWQQFRERMENLSPLESLVHSSRAALGVGSRGFGDFSWATTNVRRPNQVPDLDATSLKSLYKLLIAPIADELPSAPGARVIFVPQRSLFLVPFAALRDPAGTYLIEKYTLSIAPSLQALALTNEHPTLNLNGSALVIGNPVEMPALPQGNGQPLPALPGAEQEAVAIATLLHTQPWVNQRATETAIRQQLSDKSILHFATHGLIDFDATLNEFGLPITAEIPSAAETGVAVTPGAVIIGGNVTVGGVAAEVALAREGVVRVKMPGVLALAPDSRHDGWLSAEEIVTLDLDAQLVVLSACNTGRGRITGDGVLGLTRAFMLAGTPSIVVSLWQVPDMPTADLMTEFYRQLQQNPTDKAAALRAAMLSLKEKDPNPKNWAGFLLVGQMD